MKKSIIIAIVIIVIIIGIVIFSKYIRFISPFCSLPVYCGDIVMVNCHAEVDGPLNYYNRTTGEVISRCGGACMGAVGEQIQVCRTLCPPKDWTCKN